MPGFNPSGFKPSVPPIPPAAPSGGGSGGTVGAPIALPSATLPAIFTIQGTAIDPHNGISADGLTCDAFNEKTWFSTGGVPVLNTPEPGIPDATTISGPAGGVDGQFLITVPVSGSYWVAMYNTWDPTVVAWVKAISHPHTQLQGWTAAVVYSSRTAVTTRIAAASNGVVLPTGTINVTSTTGFPTAGLLLIQPAGPPTIVAYTGVGIGGTTFTGCTGGTGTLGTANLVGQAHQNGIYRRTVYLSLYCQVTTSGEVAFTYSYSTIGGALANAGVTGIPQFAGSTSITVGTPLIFPIDPLGYYGILATTGGSGSVILQKWVEVDF